MLAVLSGAAKEGDGVNIGTLSTAVSLLGGRAAQVYSSAIYQKMAIEHAMGKVGAGVWAVRGTGTGSMRYGHVQHVAFGAQNAVVVGCRRQCPGSSSGRVAAVVGHAAVRVPLHKLSQLHHAPSLFRLSFHCAAAAVRANCGVGRTGAHQPCGWSVQVSLLKNGISAKIKAVCVCV